METLSLLFWTVNKPSPAPEEDIISSIFQGCSVHKYPWKDCLHKNLSVFFLTGVKKYKRPTEKCLLVHRYYCNIERQLMTLMSNFASLENLLFLWVFYFNMTPMPHLSTVRGSLVCQGPAFLNNSETPRGLVNVKANCDCSHIFPDTQTQILAVMGDDFPLP